MSVYTELQPVFDKIWQEFVTGGRKRAVRQRGTMGERCIYRGDQDAHSDTRCAIGVCIPDDMYDPDLDKNSSIGSVYHAMPEWYESVFNGIPVNDLIYLQATHDHYFDTFENRMRTFARVRNLSIPE